MMTPEQQERVAEEADLILQELLDKGYPFSEELCARAWCEAKRHVERYG